MKRKLGSEEEVSYVKECREKSLDDEPLPGFNLQHKEKEDGNCAVVKSLEE